MALDVEDVGEVALEADLEAEPDRFPAVVDDVVVLVHAVPDFSVDAQVKGLGPDGASGRDQVRVGELEASRIGLHRRAVEQQRLDPAQLDAVAGDEPGVPGEVALLLGARHLEVGLAHDDLVVGVDGDDGRPHLHFHGWTAWPM